MKCSAYHDACSVSCQSVVCYKFLLSTLLCLVKASSMLGQGMTRLSVNAQSDHAGESFCDGRCYSVTCALLALMKNGPAPVLVLSNAVKALAGVSNALTLPYGIAMPFQVLPCASKGKQHILCDVHAEECACAVNSILSFGRCTKCTGAVAGAKNALGLLLALLCHSKCCLVQAKVSDA